MLDIWKGSDDKVVKKKKTISAIIELHLMIFGIFTSLWRVMHLSRIILIFPQNPPLATDSLSSPQLSFCLKGQTLSFILIKDPNGNFCFDWGRGVNGSEFPLFSVLTAQIVPTHSLGGLF